MFFGKISATLTFTDIAPSTSASASLKLFDNTLAKVLDWILHLLLIEKFNSLGD